MATPLQSDPEDFRSVLASVDRTGRRRWIYGHVVAGVWRRRRRLLSLLLIGFYLALPFISIDGRPFLRFDIPARQFWIAGHAFWPQDLSYLVPIVLIVLFSTVLAVALAGRVFCGWFCPHSVFLELVFRPIERLWQGSAPKRAAADRAGLDPARFARKVLTWITYALVAGALANTCTALFIGTEGFRWGLFVDPTAHPAAAGFFCAFFALILFNFGWFREQTCTIVCPYGRFQSALLDPHSLVVGYDAARGEPRGKAGTTTGDCVDCKLCVAVCPTGIDVRNGVQLECIHCTACIDACDSVMARLGRPGGLVRYASELELAGRPRRILRLRTLLYAAVLLALVAFLSWRLAHRDAVLVTQLRAALPQLVTAGDGRQLVRTVLPLSLVNKTGERRILHLALPADLGARITLQGDGIALAANERLEAPAIVEIPADRYLAGVLSTVLTITVSGDEPAVELPLRLRRP